MSAEGVCEKHDPIFSDGHVAGDPCPVCEALNRQAKGVEQQVIRKLAIDGAYAAGWADGIREWWDWPEEDEDLPEEDEIDAVCPTQRNSEELTGEDWAIYENAIRLCRAKQSRYGQVDLVNWLLHKALTAEREALRLAGEMAPMKCGHPSLCERSDGLCHWCHTLEVAAAAAAVTVEEG